MNQGSTIGFCLSLSIATLISVSVSARTHVPAPMTPCFSSDQKEQRAEEIFSEVAKVQPSERERNLVEVLGEVKRDMFLDNLGKEMVSRGCIFARGSRFNTESDTLSSIENSIQNPFSVDAPPWLRPGFKAALSASDSDNSIFIETRTGTGFVFHACEKKPDEPNSIAPRPSANCPVMFNSAIFVPVDEMIQRTSGLKRIISLVLRTIANVSIVFTGNLGYALVSPMAQALATLTNVDTVPRIKNEFHVRTDTRELMLLGNERSQYDGAGVTTDDRIITRLIPNVKYDDMKSALVDVVQNVFKQEYSKLKAHQKKNPNDPNIAWEPAMRIERMYYCRVNWDTDPACAKYFPTDPYAGSGADKE